VARHPDGTVYVLADGHAVVSAKPPRFAP